MHLRVDQGEGYDQNNEINNCDINLNYFKHGIIPSSILSNMKKVYPLEANIHLLNGIDFKKGCYVGQEVTARMKLKNKIPKIIFSLISDRLIDDENENEDECDDVDDSRAYIEGEKMIKINKMIDMIRKNKYEDDDEDGDHEKDKRERYRSKYRWR